MSIDRKYTGVITKADGELVDDWIVFRAKDKAVPAVLAAYYKFCETLGAEPYHLNGIKRLYERVVEYQKRFPDRVRVPDTLPNDMIFQANENEADADN